jgi:hypothetical protein
MIGLYKRKRDQSVSALVTLCGLGEQSFESLQQHYNRILSRSGFSDLDNFPCMVLGNKRDAADINVSLEEAEDWCKARRPNSQPIMYVTTSAKDGTNTVEAFEHLVSMALEGVRRAPPQAMHPPVSPKSTAPTSPSPRKSTRPDGSWIQPSTTEEKEERQQSEEEPETKQEEQEEQEEQKQEQEHDEVPQTPPPAARQEQVSIEPAEAILSPMHAAHPTPTPAASTPPTTAPRHSTTTIAATSTTTHRAIPATEPMATVGSPSNRRKPHRLASFDHANKSEQGDDNCCCCGLGVIWRLCVRTCHDEPAPDGYTPLSD